MHVEVMGIDSFQHMDPRNGTRAISLAAKAFTL